MTTRDDRQRMDDDDEGFPQPFPGMDETRWRDAAPGADHCLWCAKSGLLRYNRYQPKPAWKVFTKFTR